MKKTITLACVVLAFCGLLSKSVAQNPVTLETFYDALTPYGQWVNYPDLGYVFIPSVAPGFIPYTTNGHWEYNEQFGWSWESAYPWGWACFHYGRWNYDWQYGWIWVPDTNWGPAWVAWRNCGNYYGWAPLPWGATVNMGFAGQYSIQPEHWCFVSREHIGDMNIGAFYLPRYYNREYLEHSSVLLNAQFDNDRRFGYFKGPDRREVEPFQGNPIRIAPRREERYERTLIAPRGQRQSPRYIDIREIPVRGIR